MAYNNNNRGVLFENRKKSNESQPDMQGNVNVDGGEYRLSAWKKNSEKAGDYLSIALTPVSQIKASDGQQGYSQQTTPPQSQQQSMMGNKEDSEDLPF